jgi:hypothetical protein
MTENTKISTVARWVLPVLNGLYKLAVLAALVWIGLGLQDVAGALYSSGEGCVVESDSGNSSEEGVQPGVIKPLLRGAM